MCFQPKQAFDTKKSSVLEQIENLFEQADENDLDFETTRVLEGPSRPSVLQNEQA